MNAPIPKELEDKIVQWEGEVLHAYDDFDPKHRPHPIGSPVKGTLTIGVGHTGSDVRPGMTITREQSRNLLRKDLEWAINAVRDAVSTPLNDNQFWALVSFTFNVGAKNFRQSTLVKKLNRGDYGGAAAEFARWNKSKGKVLPGLTKRREAERSLFLTPVTRVADAPAPAPEPAPPTVAVASVPAPSRWQAVKSFFGKVFRT